MRDQRAGQATFIPLDTIQVKPVAEKFRNYAKGARLAIDCIEYEPAVERAIQHACSSSLICDTMDVARLVCYEKGQEVKGKLQLLITAEDQLLPSTGLSSTRAVSSPEVKVQAGDASSMIRPCWVSKCCELELMTGLHRLRDTYLQQLQDLGKSKPKDKADEGLLENLARLDAQSTVAKDDLVSCSEGAGTHS